MTKKGIPYTFKFFPQQWFEPDSDERNNYDVVSTDVYRDSTRRSPIQTYGLTMEEILGNEPDDLVGRVFGAIFCWDWSSYLLTDFPLVADAPSLIAAEAARLYEKEPFNLLLFSTYEVLDISDRFDGNLLTGLWRSYSYASPDLVASRQILDQADAEPLTLLMEEGVSIWLIPAND